MFMCCVHSFLSSLAVVSSVSRVCVMMMLLLVRITYKREVTTHTLVRKQTAVLFFAFFTNLENDRERETHTHIELVSSTHYIGRVK